MRIDGLNSQPMQTSKSLKIASCKINYNLELEPSYNPWIEDCNYEHESEIPT